MSYDPSHRKPRHAGRRSHAITPEEAWPALEGDAYAQGDGYWTGQDGADRQEPQASYQSAAGYRSQPGYQGAYSGAASYGYRGAAGGYAGTTDGYAGTVDGHPGAGNGWGQGGSSYGGAAGAGGWSGWPAGGNTYGAGLDAFDGGPNGYGGGVGTFDGSAGYQDPGYQDHGDYAGPLSADPVLAAPDAGVHPDSWRAERDARRAMGQRGAMVGAVTEFLAAAVAIGVSTLAAAFVRPQASPITAMGSVFIDRTPQALRNLAMQHFGGNGRTVLLLGMYVVLGLAALEIGVLARRGAALGVAGIAAFSLLGAFIVITRPQGRVSDVIPMIIGGVAGIAALLWLQRASAPAAPYRSAGGRGRA
jgi:hypothetical protein